MRVIAGRLRGRRLEAPDGQTTRPITDRVKETLFNILGSRWGEPGELPPLNVLDVFAGCGGLGIEALSRGARHCTFVERDRAALACLRVNLTRLELLAHSTVSRANAWSMRPPAAEPGFGLIFVDPPYRDTRSAPRAADLLERLATALGPDGVMVLRHGVASLAQIPPEMLRTLEVLDERTIASQRLTLLAEKRRPTTQAS
jgi:16S rRNA (guanine966-N2)-methyltransferase